MADQPVEDPFNPVTPQQQQGSWLDRPGIRSAILQASLQALQPVPIGQSPIGAIANSIGAGGEAFRRSVGTNIAQRKQKANETETQSQNDYRGALTDRLGGTSSGGALTTSQRLRAQKDQRKEWDNYLKSESEKLVAADPVNYPDANAAMAFLTSDANKSNTIAGFKKNQQLAAEATGQQTVRTAQDLIALKPDLFAQLKSGLAAGDPQALEAYKVLKSRVPDPENLDALLGGLGGDS